MKTLLTLAALALTLGHATANYADSPNIRVDTRDLTLGDLVIQGPDTIAPWQDTAYTAWVNGEDVTSQCDWPAVKCNRVIEDWWYYPDISSHGILKPKGAQPGDTIQITATYAESGGDTRKAVKKVTIGEDDGLYFNIRQEAVYLGPYGGQFQWQVAVHAEGLSASQPGVSFSWYLDDTLVGNGNSYSWTETGMPGVKTMRLTASDGQGHTGEESASIILLAPSPGEPGQRYDVWRKSGVSFTNKNGNPVVPDPAKKNNGLIILTHGLRSSPYASWIKDLAANIENKLAGAGQPNVIIFGWPEDASPGKLYGTEPERVAAVTSSLGVSADALRLVFSENGAATDFLFDGLMIREVAKNQGRSSLAKWFREEAGYGNISKTAPIHLIGHSAGGFVMGECYRELRSEGFNIRRVTMLDTPFAEKRHVESGNPAVVERYVSSLFGQLCPQIDSVRWGVPRGFYFSDKPDSTWYHRRDVGSGGHLIDQVAAHEHSYEWYDGTVDSFPEPEGFQLSPFITGAASVAISSPDGLALATLADEPPQEAPLPAVAVDGFSTFGNVSGTGSPFVLTENGNAGIVQSMTLPPDAAGLTFEYQFTAPGDGDFIVVFFGDSPPLFIASPTASNTDGVATAEVSLAPYAGQTGDLVIKLVAQESANAVVTIGAFQMTLDDDIDGDGLLAAAEVAAGTDPRFADSDGDGIDDPTELNSAGTSPVRADTDGDGVNDGSELAAGTNPLDGTSRFAVKSSVKQGTNFTIQWSAVAGRTYRVLRSAAPDFASYDVIGANIAASPPEQSFVDSNATAGSAFYRVELEP